MIILTNHCVIMLANHSTAISSNHNVTILHAWACLDMLNHLDMPKQVRSKFRTTAGTRTKFDGQSSMVKVWDQRLIYISYKIQRFYILSISCATKKILSTTRESRNLSRRRSDMDANKMTTAAPTAPTTPTAATPSANATTLTESEVRTIAQC